MPVACKPFQKRTLLWQRVIDAVAVGALGDDSGAFLAWMVADLIHILLAFGARSFAPFKFTCQRDLFRDGEGRIAGGK
jgi:hypothetical protein